MQSPLYRSSPRSLSRASVTVGLGLGLGFVAAALPGCEDNPGAQRIAEQCGLDINCEAGGIAEGNAHISGIASVDSFFGAVIDINARVGQLNGSIQAQIDGMAASVGLPPGSAAADIRGAIEARVSAAVEGGLQIQAEPARCETSVEIVASAAAECDASVDPGEVSFACEGSCEVEAGVAVDCGAEAELHCTVAAPSVECSGSCQGTCQLDPGAECEGSCKGGCDGVCAVENADGTCNGRCDGTCTGSCELDVAAECQGQCEGQCDYVEPSGQCDASAEARCDAMAGGSVQCDAGCSGSAQPPSVSAECEASVDAKASASVECTPPQVAITWSWSAEFAADADAQAEFRGFITDLRLRYSAILAARAQADLVLDAGLGLIDAASGAVTNAAADLEAGGDIRAVFGARCALEELPIAAEALQASIGDLTASASAAAEVSAAIGG